MKIQTPTSFIALSAFILLSGCSKSDSEDTRLACTNQIQSAYMNFNVVEAGTGQDLFFSNDPQYSTSQVGFFKIKDKLFKDTIKPEIIGSGTARYFKISIENVKPKDTLVMTLPLSRRDFPADMITYTIKKTVGRCPEYVLDKAEFNKAEIMQIDGRLTLKKMRTVDIN
jgi:hypothetical protein